MKRNIEKTVKEGRKHITNRNDLTLSEIEELIEGKAHGYDIATQAFYFGYEIGRRAEAGRIEA